jgi:hypothetical protein
MAPLIGLITILCGLWFLIGMPVAAAVFALEYRRTRVLRSRLIAAGVMLGVFYITAGLLWGNMTTDWNLSFPTTLKATVDSETYGHEVEHRAEVMIVNLVLLSTLAAAAAGAVVGCVGFLVLKRHPSDPGLHRAEG